MKIIFICSDPSYLNGEHYTPECETTVSIKHAASAAVQIDSIIQAIDIADLTDIEDVTEQVAEALTWYLHENVDIVPQYALGHDMQALVTELDGEIAEENQYHCQVSADYASGVL